MTSPAAGGLRTVELGITVPGGDPHALDGARGDLRAVAHVAGVTADALNHHTYIHGWHGVASDQYAQAAAASAKAAQQAHDCLRAAAAVLGTLADELGKAQRVAGQALDAARTANASKTGAETAAADADRSARSNSAAADLERQAIDTALASNDHHSAALARVNHADFTRSAQAAAADAASARRRVDHAAEDLDAAQQRGRRAFDHYEQACQDAARALHAIAEQAPDVAHHGEGGSPLEKALEALRSLWEGGAGERNLALATVHEFVKTIGEIGEHYGWLKAQELVADWERVAPGAPGNFTEMLAGDLADKTAEIEKGPFGKILTNVLDHIPGGERASGWLSDASGGLPILRGLGIAGGVVSIVHGGVSLYHDALDHPGKHPAKLVADIAHEGFNVSSTAFLMDPADPVAAGAVVVTGVVWAGAEIVENRKKIGKALDAGVDVAGKGLSEVGHGLSSAAHALGL